MQRVVNKWTSPRRLGTRYYYKFALSVQPSFKWSLWRGRKSVWEREIESEGVRGPKKEREREDKSEGVRG